MFICAQAVNFLSVEHCDRLRYTLVYNSPSVRRTVSGTIPKFVNSHSFTIDLLILSLSLSLSLSFSLFLCVSHGMKVR